VRDISEVLGSLDATNVGAGGKVVGGKLRPLLNGVAAGKGRHGAEDIFIDFWGNLTCVAFV